MGDLISVQNNLHRVVAEVGERLLLVDVATQRVYLEQSRDGTIGLPSRAHIADMLHAGRLCIGAPANTDIERMDLEIRSLDAAGVKNGSKAIWLWLKANWTGDLVARLGPHDDPASIRRWRTLARKNQKTQPPDAGECDPP